jgi:hypothetical protein
VEKIDLIMFFLADISKKQGIIVQLESKAASQGATISSSSKEV